MNFSQRSYTNGETFRPRPVIAERPEDGLVVVATPWGSVDSAQKVVEIILEQFDLLSADETVAPMEFLPSLSPAANKLRMGLIMANQYLCRNENAKQWRTAVEISVVHFAAGVLSWVHVGSPHLFLSDGENLHPLAYEVDLSMQSGNKGPLFSKALGLDANLHFNAGSVRVPVEAEPQILLLARSRVPSCFFVKASEQKRFDVEGLLEDLIQDQDSDPCWLGLIDVA